MPSGTEAAGNGLLAKVSSALVWLLDHSGKAILWTLGHRGDAEEKVSEDEIRTLVVEAENAGVLEPGEKEMIAGVMRLGDLAVGAVMTPRHEVDQINFGDDPETIRKAFVFAIWCGKLLTFLKVSMHGMLSRS